MSETMIVTRARAAKLVRAREEPAAESEETSLFPPFARQRLEALGQPALDAAAEMVGVHTVPATVDAVMEQQARVDFFPFVRTWSAVLLESDARLLATACALAGVVKEVDAALQWRDAVTSFAVLVICGRTNHNQEVTGAVFHPSPSPLRQSSHATIDTPTTDAPKQHDSY